MGLLLPFASMAFLAVVVLVALYFFARNQRIRMRSTIQYDKSLPQPSHFLVGALFVTGVVLITSAVPFQLRPASEASYNDYLKPRDVRPARQLLEDPQEQFSWRVILGGDSFYVPENTTDFVNNILFAMPLAFFWLGAFLVDSEHRLGKVATVVLGVLAFTAVRIVMEYCQQRVVFRVVAQFDVIAQSIGVALGGVAWLIAGQRFTDWIRSKTIDLRPFSVWTWLLVIYFLGFLVYSIWPLEITIRGADLARRFQRGYIYFIPFSEPDWQPKLLVTVLTYIPIGMLMATALLSPAERMRSLGSTLVGGLLFVLPIEFAEMFVVGRVAKTTDILSGLLGVFVGWVIIYLFRGSMRPSRMRSEHLPFSARVTPYLVGSLAYGIVLFVIFCFLFTPIRDQVLIESRYMGFYQLLPDAGRFASPFEAVLYAARQALIFAPLGALLAMTAVGPTIPVPVRVILLSVAVVSSMIVAFCIEMWQVFLPPHVSDIMDVIWGSIGAVAGVAITAYLAIFRNRRQNLRQELETTW